MDEVGAGGGAGSQAARTFLGDLVALEGDPPGLRKEGEAGEVGGRAVELLLEVVVLAAAVGVGVAVDAGSVDIVVLVVVVCVAVLHGLGMAARTL